MSNQQTRRINGQQTHLAAKFLVAAELERHGYDVKFARDQPAAGLIASRPASGIEFGVHVKGQRTQSPWWAEKEPESPNLFYVLVFVGQTRNVDRFFVLDQPEFNNLVEQFRLTHPNQRYGGFNWGDPLKFEGQWQKLPGWNANHMLRAL